MVSLYLSGLSLDAVGIHTGFNQGTVNRALRGRDITIRNAHDRVKNRPGKLPSPLVQQQLRTIRTGRV